MLGTLTPDQKKDWKLHLLTMCHANNSTQHSVTGFSPYYLMSARHPRLPIDYQLGITRDNLAQPSKFRFVNKLNLLNLDLSISLMKDYMKLILRGYFVNML